MLSTKFTAGGLSREGERSSLPRTKRGLKIKALAIGDRVKTRALKWMVGLFASSCIAISREPLTV